MRWFEVIKRHDALGISTEGISIMTKLTRYRQEKWQSNIETGKQLFSKRLENFTEQLADFAKEQQLQFSPNAIQRLKRISLVLGDPISMRQREVVGGYRFGTGEVLIGIDQVDHVEAWQQTIQHELFHAASGHLLLRDKNMQLEATDFFLPEQTSSTSQLSNNDTGLAKLLEAAMQNAAGLSIDDDSFNVNEPEMDFNFAQEPIEVTRYGRNGLHFTVGRDRFEWLSEAATEELTVLYQHYCKKADSGDYYGKERQLFSLLLTSGNITLEPSVIFNAYLEDYIPKSEPRLPHWQAFMQQLAISYGGGF